jgi:threonine/homoserine efflux transporter RhtA
MEHFLLSVHVVAGIVFVGGSAVATSLFPRYVPVGAAVPDAPSPLPSETPQASGERNRAVAVALHRITRGYSALGLIVPAAGIVLTFAQGRSGEIWITVSMVLTAAAGVLLAFQIIPRQRDALAEPGDHGRLRTMHMLVGLYNVLWAIVVVLMIVRPGSAGA